MPPGACARKSTGSTGKRSNVIPLLDRNRGDRSFKSPERTWPRVRLCAASNFLSSSGIRPKNGPSSASVRYNPPLTLLTWLRQ